MQKDKAPLELFHFDRDHIQQRINLLGLSRDDQYWAEQLQQYVISPKLDLLVDEFYQNILAFPEIVHISAGYELAEMKDTQRKYLRSLGLEFYTPQYFENRLRIGLTHEQINLSPALFQCACHILSKQLIAAIPKDYQQQAALSRFILNIIALDTSLALEAYHPEFIEKLKSTAQNLEKARQKPLTVDESTGVLNRKGILELLSTKLYTVAFPKPLSVLIAHVDHFNGINQEHGTQTCEDLLKNIVVHFQGLVRGSNTIGRFGSQEFLILLHNTNLEQGHIVAERLRVHIAKQSFTTTNGTFSLSLSIGIACAAPEDTMITLIERADSALYEARRRGHNRVIGATL